MYVVIARFPPPIGGVSVFARRKADTLRRQGARVLEVDLGRSGWFLQLLKTRLALGNRRLLVNTLHPLMLFTLWILGLLSGSTLYDHNASRHYKKSAKKAQLLLFFCRRAKEVTVVHPRLAEWFVSHGIRTSVESPFIPPDSSREHNVLKTYPQELHEFLDQKGQFVLLNSAWRYVPDDLGGDLYGLRQTLALMRMFRERGLPCRLIFSFGEFNRNEIPAPLRESMDELIHEGMLYILTGQREIWPLFSRVDLFLRTTSTDGESVSVLEALHFKCPVVASDVVPRPSGVRIYEYKSLQSLYEATFECFEARFIGRKLRELEIKK